MGPLCGSCLGSADMKREGRTDSTYEYYVMESQHCRGCKGWSTLLAQIGIGVVFQLIVTVALVITGTGVDPRASIMRKIFLS